MKKNTLIIATLLIGLTSLTGCKKKHEEINLSHDKTYWSDPAHSEELKKAMKFCDEKFGTAKRDLACSTITDVVAKKSWAKALGGNSENSSMAQLLGKGDNLW